jgi:hypothetical protein
VPTAPGRGVYNQEGSYPRPTVEPVASSILVQIPSLSSPSILRVLRGLWTSIVYPLLFDTSPRDLHYCQARMTFSLLRSLELMAALPIPVRQAHIALCSVIVSACSKPRLWWPRTVSVCEPPAASRTRADAMRRPRGFAQSYEDLGRTTLASRRGVTKKRGNPRLQSCVSESNIPYFLNRTPPFTFPLRILYYSVSFFFVLSISGARV